MRLSFLFVVACVLAISAPAWAATASEAISWTCGHPTPAGNAGKFNCNSPYQFISGGSWTFDFDIDAGSSAFGSYVLTLGSVAQVSCSVAAGVLVACSVDEGSGFEGDYRMSARFDRITCVFACPWSATMTFTQG